MLTQFDQFANMVTIVDKSCEKRDTDRQRSSFGLSGGTPGGHVTTWKPNFF